MSYGLSATAKCLPRTVRLAERDGPGPCSSDSSNRVPTLRLPPRARRRAARQPAESPERRWPSQSQGQTADKQEHGARTCEAARAGGSRGRDRAPIFRPDTSHAANSSRAILPLVLPARCSCTVIKSTRGPLACTGFRMLPALHLGSVQVGSRVCFLFFFFYFLFFLFFFLFSFCSPFLFIFIFSVLC